MRSQWALIYLGEKINTLCFGEIGLGAKKSSGRMIMKNRTFLFVVQSGEIVSCGLKNV
jgi:hypothetical protein